MATTQLGIQTTREENFSKWYTEVITKAEMIEYYNVSGCYILRPWSYKMWEFIQRFFDGEIKEMGVEPCYFPMFVSERDLNKEKDHIEDFAPEVAWVTKSGDTDLEEPIAIRPTSETIMYPAFATWIRSHRDLPLRLNQWTNVVRWEFKSPTPFLRTREFLWQEGHTAFATREEADKEVIDVLDLYARIYEELLAVPVIKGRKSAKEKFPGGDYTTTIEAFIPGAGRAIQAATSHSLGQNFSKMFNITFSSEDGSSKDMAKLKKQKQKNKQKQKQQQQKQQQKGKQKGKQGQAAGADGAEAAAEAAAEEAEVEVEVDAEANYVWQNSWGCTTRSIGVCVMVHGDNQGLVLPPRVAPLQVVGVSIRMRKPEVNAPMDAAMNGLMAELKQRGVRASYDERADKKPGWKYNYHEQRGVPLRVEVGSRDVAAKQCVLVRRDNGVKETVPLADAAARVSALLEEIQQDMLDRARRERDARVSVVWTWDEFVVALDKGNLVLAPWSLTTASEEWVKDETKRLGELTRQAAEAAEAKGAKGAGSQGEAVDEENEKGETKALTGAAKTLCIPFIQPPLPEGTPCFTGHGGLPAKEWCLWGRSY